jgi:hypothetical protein
MTSAQVQVSRTTGERIAQGVSTVMALGPVAYLAWIWSDLPERVPSHFGLDGQADRFGDAALFWLLPVSSLVLFSLLTLLERVPQVYSYPFPVADHNREPTYRLGRQLVLGVKTVCSMVFAYITVAGAQTALGHTNGLGAWFTPVIVALILLGVGISILRLVHVARYSRMRDQ